MADDEPVASRTRSQTATDEPIAARTRQALGSDPEMSAFADVKNENTLNEWLHEIAFVTSRMSDPYEPQSFQEAWWDPDLVAREKWLEAICLEFKKMLDMGVWRHVKRRDHPNDHRFVRCRWVFKVKLNGLNATWLQQQQLPWSMTMSQCLFRQTSSHALVSCLFPESHGLLGMNIIQCAVAQVGSCGG